MDNILAYNTVNPLLVSVLTDLMREKAFDDFVLVGGTALSLRLGHRISVDIDLFSDKPYGSLEYNAVDAFFKSRYPYVDSPDRTNIVGLGRSYYVGESDRECIKVDLYYTDAFIRPYSRIGNIRLASLDDIVAMKVDVIGRKGRKKDFWDLHELLERYPIKRMLELHEERYPYSHDREVILKNFTDFRQADDDFDPICLRGKYWEVIKADFIDIIKP
jgi:predicted nucleotidyltransferase component of viral defense system